MKKYQNQFTKIKTLFGLFVITMLQFVNAQVNNNTSTSITITIDEGTNMAAALSPDKKELVIDVLGRLWILPVEGGEAIVITDSLGDARQPAWSPDGKQICFQAYWDGNWHIYIINKDGTNLQQITHGAYDHREPDWSPLGNQLAFSSDRSGTYDIWFYDFGKEELIQATTEPANETAPNWSAGGRSLVFVSDDPDNPGLKFWIKRYGNISPIQRVEGNLTGVSRSSGGTAILFNQLTEEGSYLMKLNLEKPNAAPVLISKEDEDVFPFRVSWMDDTNFIYTADGKIKKSNLDGTDMTEIPFFATIHLDRKKYTKRKRNFDPENNLLVKGITSPNISPDGKSIAFIALADLWIKNEKEAAQQITNDAFVELSPVWSHDNNTLAYVTERTGEFALVIRNRQTGIEKIVAKTGGQTVGMSWSPDDKQIVYTLSFGPRLGQLWMMDLATGEKHQIGKALPYSPSAPSYSADGKTIAMAMLKPYSKLYREGVNRIIFYSQDGTQTWGQKALEHWSFGVRTEASPIWSPDGKWMAVINSSVLWILPVDSKGQVNGMPIRLTNELADSPSWTGDSKNIIYQSLNQLKKINIIDGTISKLPIGMKWNRTAPKEKISIHVKAVFDGLTESLIFDQDIIIEQNRIVGIEKHNPNRIADKKIDASDDYAMPGLIDIHSHQGSWGGEIINRKWLAWGVTSTRDPATDPYDALNRKEANESGKIHGPRVFFTGSPIDGNRIYYSGTFAQQSVAQLELELQKAAAFDFDFIKTYVRLADPLQKRVVQKAHELGIPVTSHELYPAVSYGTDGVEHILGTSRRGYSPKMTSMFKSYSDVTDILAKSGMSFTPTIGIYVSYAYLLAQNESLLEDERWTTFEPPYILADAKGRINKVKTQQEIYKKRMENAGQMIRDVYDKGGLIVAGTDGPIIPYGISLHLELEAYAAAGVPIVAVLKTAGINAAKALGAEADLGTLEKGKLADLIIVKENPLENIRNIRDIQYVIQNGNVYTVKELLGK